MADDRVDIASIIDHTLLKPEATRAEINRLCDEAREHHFAAVCVNPVYVSFAARQLADSGVKTCTVIAFPLGAATSEAKSFEARNAISNGAEELDMVLNIGALKSKEDGFVEADIRAVREAAQGRTLKVILETGSLSAEEKVRGCLLAKKAGADFVKTSTGFGAGGATIEDVRLMRATVGPQMGVKASGGIRDIASARAMMAAGATRLGTSAGVAIILGLLRKEEPSASGSRY